VVVYCKSVFANFVVNQYCTRIWRLFLLCCMRCVACTLKKNTAMTGVHFIIEIVSRTSYACYWRGVPSRSRWRGTKAYHHLLEKPGACLGMPTMWKTDCIYLKPVLNAQVALDLSACVLHLKLATLRCLRPRYCWLAYLGCIVVQFFLHVKLRVLSCSVLWRITRVMRAVLSKWVVDSLCKIIVEVLYT